MLWNETDYPGLMKDLPLPVRTKAIEIANALMENGQAEEKSIIIDAINLAKEWAEKQAAEAEKIEKQQNILKHFKADEHFVIPYGEKEWAVKEKGKKKVIYVFHTKKKAIELATSEAKKANSAVTIQKRSGKIEKRISFKVEEPKEKSTITKKKR